MRKDFSTWMEKTFQKNESIIFLTGDLGYRALENVRDACRERFVNMGVSEQNMVSVAAGLAQQGLTPFCYSIAPFVVFRPSEQIRLDVCIHNLNVKLVGNGGGYGYGIMGATHHALEDLAMLSSFQNMVCYIPFCNEDVENVCQAMMGRQGPAYLRLGYGAKPQSVQLPPYQQLRQLSLGSDYTVLGVGPIILNAFQAIESSKKSADIFVLSEFPILQLTDNFIESLKKTKKLLIIEEHVRRGGLLEMISALILEEGISIQVKGLSAKGYPNRRYGSQAYHQEISELSAEAITHAMEKMNHA